jgi:hypothetical protein
MPDTGTAPHKSGGKIGGVKKEYVYAGVAVGGVLLVVVYMRSKSKAAATGATVTDPAGNVCAALNPSSGYCPGSPQDLSYTGTGSTLAGSNSASYVGGQIIGYDQYGNPIYSSSTSQTGVPGAYTNDAQWTQAALISLQQADPSTSSEIISAALGAYINGVAATSDQQSIIQQAIALQGFPPVGGQNGYPPSIKNAPAATTPPPTNNPPPSGNLVAPSGLNVHPTKTTAPASWNAVSGATGYVFVYWRLSGGSAITTPTKAQSVVMSKLLPKNKYYCYVYATNGTTKGAHSPAVLFTTL